MVSAKADDSQNLANSACVLILAAQLLRYWTIATLGRQWNTRIVVSTSQPLVKTGPYHFFKHPNYLAVVLEIAFVPSFIGAWYTAIIFSIFNGALLYFIRIPAEEQALKKSFEKHDSPSA